MTTIFSSAAPLHSQLEMLLRSQIAGGAFAEGDQLPTENELIATYSVSRAVVRQALHSLVVSNLVTRRPGKGSFVSRTEAKHDSWSVGTIEDLIAYGKRTSFHLLDRNDVVGPPFATSALNLPDGEMLHQIRNLRRFDEGLFAYQQSYVPRDIGSKISDHDLTTKAIFGSVEELFGLSIIRVEQVISAVSADHESSKLLEVKKSTPLLETRRTYVTSQRGPVIHAVVRYRPDRYQQNYALSRSTLRSR